jgi:hypothetical protein
MVVPPSLDGEWFERTERCGAFDLRNGADVMFLMRVLEHRAGDVLNEAVRTRLMVASGGILRDLMSLARSAVEEAYIEGKDRVDVAHVQAAAVRMGRALLRGRDFKEIVRLVPKGFSARTEPTVVIADTDRPAEALVLGRIVIPQSGWPEQHIVHPSIVPFLPGASS